MVDEALAKGAKLISGGSKHHVGDLQYKPTILTNVTNDMSLMREEVFGPVISITKFETEEVGKLKHLWKIIISFFINGRKPWSWPMTVKWDSLDTFSPMT